MKLVFIQLHQEYNDNKDGVDHEEEEDGTISKLTEALSNNSL
jgi:hypothetical protein